MRAEANRLATVALAIGVVVGQGSAGRADEASPRKPRVAVIGDSQAWLLMHDLPRVALADGVEVRGWTVPGSSVLSWSGYRHEVELARMRAWHPDLVVVVLGSNDAYMASHVLAGEPARIRSLLWRLYHRGHRVVWVGPTKLPQARRGLEIFKRMVAEEGLVRYLDSSSIDIEQWGDELHCARPAPGGCARWASWIWIRVRWEFVGTDPFEDRK